MRWRYIPGFNKLYKISDSGVIVNSYGLQIKTQIQNSGYVIAHLYCDGVRKALTVHRLVAFLYVKNPLNKTQVNHDDLNKLNNHYKNLKWSTPSENMIHAFESGRMNNSIEKARIRMSSIGKKYSKINGMRLKTRERDSLGRIK